MRHINKTVILLVLAALIGSIGFAMTPLNRLAITSRTGEVSPDNFPIGPLETDLETARSILERHGLTYGQMLEDGRCANVELGINQRAHLFHDRSWRRGVFCLFEEDGVVTRVAWWMSPGAP